MPAYTLRDDDPESLRAFVATLGRRDPKTVAAALRRRDQPDHLSVPAIATTARYTLPTRTQIREQLKTLPG